MTAQALERLIFEGSEHSMCSLPLGDFFRLGGKRPDFRWPHTGCRRGYIGTWEVIDGRLYLIQLQGWLKSGEDASLETVFPGYGGQVFAHWFTDTIRLPQGKRLKGTYTGGGSIINAPRIYEKDLLLRFNKGKLIARSVRQNGPNESEEPDGHGIDALTPLGNLSAEG